MWPNPQETADLVTFTREIINGKLHFLCSENVYQIPKQTFFREFDFSKIITKKYRRLGLCDVSFA